MLLKQGENSLPVLLRALSNKGGTAHCVSCEFSDKPNTREANQTSTLMSRRPTAPGRDRLPECIAEFLEARCSYPARTR